MSASIKPISGASRRLVTKSFLRPRNFIALCCACAVLGLSGTSRGQSLELIEGFEGNSTGWIPADPIIAAGPNSLVTMLSGVIAIFDKQGTKLFEQNLGAGGFWAAQGADLVAEPWIIFDPNSGRFVAIAREVGNNLGRVYLAVSKTSNPLGSADWHKYGLDRSGTHQGSNFPGVATYPDYPKVGVDGDAIYITSLHFAKDRNITLNFSHAEIFALEKAPLLSGGPLNVVFDDPIITNSYSPFLVFSIHPAVVFEPAPAMYFVQSLITRPDDKIVIHTLSDVLSGNPSRSVSFVPVAPFDRPPDGVPQLGSATLLENVGARLISGVVRNGALWTAHAVLDPDDGESVVRWYQVDLTGVPAMGATLVQSGDVDPGPGIHTWLPHINVDADGNMGLCFSVGGASQYAAIGYTGRLASDAAGTTLPVQIARAGEGPYTEGGWGEYSGLAIDPDGSTFWLFHQYPLQNPRKWNRWGTFVGAFEVRPPTPASDPLHSGDLDGSGVNSGKNWKATVVTAIHDGNENGIEGAAVSIQWSTGATATAVTDATGKATFTLNSISKLTSSVALTISGVTYPGLTYAPSANHDPEADSNGTSITVAKP
jgi:hypothetical protein